MIYRLVGELWINEKEQTAEQGDVNSDCRSDGKSQGENVFTVHFKILSKTLSNELIAKRYASVAPHAIYLAGELVFRVILGFFGSWLVKERQRVYHVAFLV